MIPFGRVRDRHAHERRRVTSRAQVLALSLGAVLLPPPVLAQNALVQIKAGSALDDEATPYLYAMQSGLFRRNGIDALVQPVTSGSVSAAGVIGGAYDVGQSSVTSLCAAHARGLPLVLVAPAGLFDAALGQFALVVRSDSPIRTGADLSGKTVSVSSLNDYFSLAVRAWTDAQGGDSSTVKLIEVPMPLSAAAVVSGRIDGAALVQPFLDAAVAGKQVRSIGNPGAALGQRYLQSAWFMTKDYTEKNPDVVLRFIRVMREAQTYANAHPAETAPLLAQFTKVEANAVPAVRTRQGVTFDLGMIQPLIDAAARYKMIPARFDARDFIYPAALRA